MSLGDVTWLAFHLNSLILQFHGLVAICDGNLDVRPCNGSSISEPLYSVMEEYDFAKVAGNFLFY